MKNTAKILLIFFITALLAFGIYLLLIRNNIIGSDSFDLSAAKTGDVRGSQEVFIQDSFSFSISPDGRYVVLLKQSNDSTWQFGKKYTLAVIDLENENVKEFDIDEKTMNSVRMKIKDNCWSLDGTYCQIAPGDQILVSSNNEPVLNIYREEKDRLPVSYTKYFTCSDCGNYENRKNLVEDLFERDSTPPWENENIEVSYDDVVVSFDESTYYYIGKQDNRQTIYQYSLRDKQTNVLVEIPKGYCAANLSVSPADTHLAYNIRKGCSGYSLPPKLHVLDLGTLKEDKTNHDAAYAMHFSPDGKKIYYFNGFKKALEFYAL